MVVAFVGILLKINSTAANTGGGETDKKTLLFEHTMNALETSRRKCHIKQYYITVCVWKTLRNITTAGSDDIIKFYKNRLIPPNLYT